MAAYLERLAREWAQKGYPGMETYLNAGARLARELGAPESFSVDGTPDVVKSPEAPMGVKDLQLRLQSTIQEYKTQPHTPELVNSFWRTFLETQIRTQGLDIPVPIITCDRTQEELEVLKEDGRMWVPETKLTYPQLGQIFPRMESSDVQKDTLNKEKFDQDAKGVDVEVSIDSPYRNTSDIDLERLFKSQGRSGMRLSTFILASQASKVLTGHYFDEGATWSRLLGSRIGLFGYHVVVAHIYADGILRLRWDLYVGGRDPGLGGRSEGV